MKTEDDPGGHKSKHSGNGLRQLVKNRALSDLKGLSGRFLRKRRLRRAGSGEDGDFTPEPDQKSASGHYANGRYTLLPTLLPKVEDEATHSQYRKDSWQLPATSFYYDGQGTPGLTGKSYYQNAHNTNNTNNTNDVFSSIANKTIQVKEFLNDFNEPEDAEDLKDRLETILQEVSRQQADSHTEALNPTRWLRLFKYF